ncbi:venom allergen-1-like isoform X2 [Eurosta solidaginis]|uniref:venom allergen-1-like isoform X2 n=1 Tax=Eurosta solidaginis TaxID=178769 RepID=UPI003530A634
MAFMSLQIIIPTLLIIAQFVYATNYCDPSLCNGDHIACHNNEGFHSSCKKPQDVQLTNNLKQLILDTHNKYRNKVAGGATALKPACRMATLQWDNELASLAALNVKQCKMAHDECHNTDAYKYSGQNLAWITYYNTADIKYLTGKSVDLWYNEIKDTKMSHIKSYPANYIGPQIGHFTVMMADRNIRVGCAASTYAVKGDNYRAFLFACNYATTNMIGFPIYKDCKKPATECKVDKNSKYPNLCAVSEKYDVNKWF